MLPEKRKQIILKTLEHEGSVRTIDLAARLEVADETIRRDLELLAGEGLLKRSHGGAIRIAAEKIESTYDERRVRNIVDKKAVAVRTLEFIDADDCVYLDASSTTLQLASLLGEKPLTVITNSLLVANAVSKRTTIELILTGGTLDHHSYGFVGPGVLRSLEHYTIDKLFCSGNGIHADYGLTEVNEWQSHIKEVAIKRSNFRCFLGDSTKPGAFSAYCFGQCRNLDLLITTSTADSKAVAAIEGCGSEVVITPQ